MDYIVTFILLFAVILIVIILFWLVDKYLNAKPKAKSTEKKAPEPQPKIAEPEQHENLPPDAPEQIVTGDSVISGGLSLADEINKEIQKDGQQGPKTFHSSVTRIRAFDRIQKFRESRHYENYDNDNPDKEQPDDNQNGYSADEYNKILALAVDKKNWGDASHP